MASACSKPEVPSGDFKDSIAESLAPPLHNDLGEQSRRRSNPPAWCRDLDSLPEADQVTLAVLPTLLVLHPSHPMARLRVKRRRPPGSLPAQHRVLLASGTASLV